MKLPSARKIAAIVVARNKEFYRDKGVLAWNFVFPFLVIFGFAYMFTGKPQPQYKVALHGAVGRAALGGDFLSLDYVQYVDVAELGDGIERVRRHRVDLLLDLSSSPVRYWVNPTSPKGYLIERVLKGSVGDPASITRAEAPGRGIRYVDWLIPGILSMNIMFSTLFGVGYVIVRYRKNGMLKRLKATPLRPFEFLAGQVVSRLTLVAATTTIIVVGTRLFVDFQMAGSYLALATVLAAGAVCLISLSLVVAARVASEEVAAGLLNLLSWPMLFLSGVWFSLDGANPWVVRLAQLLPLTHMIDAARAVMLDGAGFAAIGPHLAVLGGMAVACLALGSALFRWY